MKKSITQTIVSFYDSILTYGLDKNDLANVKEMSEPEKLYIWEAGCWQDIIAFPAFLLFIDPVGLKISEIQKLFDFWTLNREEDILIAFTRKPQIPVPPEIKEKVMDYSLYIS
ncbi:hypothetical protein PP175_15390 [Aneurinibacillus sp. Ricciae_BoGa-3]|uniref:hypothetical protein n=1 Tax=Aneurinibacillus sp. Ricciae_BoGa-3 TaxID=3022697 RepID=UPI0023401D8F|nr:hypothetical protein [Aneurinibacillus sp. Ricciae_BoGa-3]WCK52804.1 hypothetical protein PP175_15390 [Aneurinibacillus sp. Ricciae_BoGa-3]